MNPIVSAGAIKVKVTEPGEVYAQATERVRKWNATEVELVLEGGKAYAAMCDPDGVAPVLGVPLDATVQEVRVRRRGPCAIPIPWVVKTQPPAANFKPGAEVSVEISARLRNSVWTSGSGMFDDKGGLRSDVIDDLAGTVDDLSMLETFFMKVDKPEVGFDPRFLKGKPAEADKAALCKQVIDACHAKGIQLLCGYEGVAEGGKNSAQAEAFKEFLKKATIRDIEDHARAIHHKIFVDLKLDFDGIGFDIETVGVNTMDQQFEALYGTLAQLLAKDNRILTYASATFAKDGETSHEAAHMRSQRYSLAKLAPNIIARPMGYDGGHVYNEQTKKGLHKEGIDCALGDVGLHPSQFQMGVKLVGFLLSGGRQKVGISSPWDAATVQKRCDDLYRPNRIGLISFAIGGPSEPSSAQMRTSIKSFDPKLNPRGPKAGTVGSPLQCPRRTANGR